MKKITLLSLLLLFCLVAFTQKVENERVFSSKNFIIENNTTQNPDKYYIEIISSANLESFRLRDKDVVLKFKNGFECLLPSASKLFIEDHDSILKYPKDFPDYFIMPEFLINENGHFIISYHKTAVK